jgi:hypothetical protein
MKLNLVKNEKEVKTIRVKNSTYDQLQYYKKEKNVYFPIISER